jgi:molybdopterin-guanine dinucleotide biosynthesis protein A
VLLAGGDMPALRPDVLRLLVDALRSDPAAEVAVLEHEPFAPLPAALRIGPAHAAATATLAVGRRSLTACFDRLRTVTVPAATWRAIDPDAATLRDIDRPADVSAS